MKSAKYKFSYGVTRRNNHLGLVRRRVGRGGRIILDRYSHYYNNENSFNYKNHEITTMSDCEKM